MDTDFAWSERKTFGCGMGEIPETLYAEAGRLPMVEHLGNLRKNKQPKEPHEAFLREL